MRQRVPLRLMLVMVALPLLVGESFPFSRFRMYSTFPPLAGYLYLADGQDAPIPLEREFGMRTAFLKKRFKAVLEEVGGELPDADDERARAVAGERTLRYLLDNRHPEVDPPARYRRLRLYRVQVTTDAAGRLSRSRSLVSEIEVP